MNRLLLCLSILFFTSITYAQFKEVSVPDHLNKATLMPDKTLIPNGTIHQQFIPGQKFEEVVFGETVYDLQTYNAMQQRMYVYPDETIATTWMLGHEVGSWGDRGTGYNYFDGQNWAPYPIVRLETESTGWPTYAPFGEHGELVCAFYFEDPYWELVFNKRGQKGEGEWESFYLPGPIDMGIAWPAIITNGEDNNTIHLLCISTGSPYMGQAGALLYSRSLDGGETWDIQHQFFEELGSNYLTRVPGDGYSWADPRGDTLAFCIGFRTEDGYIMKSYDNGTTWTKSVVYDSPYSPYPGGATPIYGAGDITQSIALDHQGMAHVTFGRMKYYYNNGGNLMYFPATEGLIYWNEYMEPLDSTIVSSYTLDKLINNGNLIGWITPYLGDSTIVGWGNYYVSLTSWPQINIDEQDRIFVVYSSIAAGYDNGLKNFRHIFGNSSNDGGVSWNGIKDFCTDISYLFAECNFPAMSPTFVNNTIHFYFEKDDQPGLHVWTNEHDPITNEFVYMPVDIPFLTGKEEIYQDKDQSLSIINYPNPFSDYTSLIFNMPEQGTVHLNIYNINGQLMRKRKYTCNKGQNKLILERKNLTPGIYFYTIMLDKNSLSGKMIIE